MNSPLIVRTLGRSDYQSTWQAMQHFTQQRKRESADEIWLTEHPAIFTQGLAGRPEHLLEAGDIPLLQSDRGGQITYHGPGQLIAYTLIDLRRAGFGVRSLVNRLEQAVITLLLQHYHIKANHRSDAPGVYIEQRKIAALGLRIRQGCCYHGLSLNVAMDLTPFKQINTCGYPDLQVTQLSDFGINESVATIGQKLLPHLLHELAETGPCQQTNEAYAIPL
ncbi:MAG: lipoyl(octanoyl) transferase LipB [Candidatus Polarisedimenticolaceae bacterium]|nr:lipoyl(octanoyl) transferase LipB [Candidatus Polarisedimenticolaceae bacterium]